MLENEMFHWRWRKSTTSTQTQEINNSLYLNNAENYFIALVINSTEKNIFRNRSYLLCYLLHAYTYTQLHFHHVWFYCAADVCICIDRNCQSIKETTLSVYDTIYARAESNSNIQQAVYLLSYRRRSSSLCCWCSVDYEDARTLRSNADICPDSTLL